MLQGKAKQAQHDASRTDGHKAGGGANAVDEDSGERRAEGDAPGEGRAVPAHRLTAAALVDKFGDLLRGCRQHGCAQQARQQREQAQGPGVLREGHRNGQGGHAEQQQDRRNGPVQGAVDQPADHRGAAPEEKHQPDLGLVAAGFERRHDADVGAAEDHARPGRDGEDGGYGGGEPGEIVDDPVPQPGPFPAPFPGGGQRGELGGGFLQVRRGSGDHGDLGGFLLACLEHGYGPGVGIRAAGRRVEPHQEQPGHRGGDPDGGQPHDRESGRRDQGTGSRSHHKDQFGGDGVEGERSPALFPRGKYAEGLAHHTEDRQRQQSADEHQWQQDLVGHVRHDGPDDGL